MCTSFFTSRGNDVKCTPSISIWRTFPNRHGLGLKILAKLSRVRLSKMVLSRSRFEAASPEDEDEKTGKKSSSISSSSRRRRRRRRRLWPMETAYATKVSRRGWDAKQGDYLGQSHRRGSIELEEEPIAVNQYILLPRGSRLARIRSCHALIQLVEATCSRSHTPIVLIHIHTHAHTHKCSR